MYKSSCSLFQPFLNKFKVRIEDKYIFMLCCPNHFVSFVLQPLQQWLQKCLHLSTHIRSCSAVSLQDTPFHNQQRITGDKMKYPFHLLETNTLSKNMISVFMLCSNGRRLSQNLNVHIILFISCSLMFSQFHSILCCNLYCLTF